MRGSVKGDEPVALRSWKEDQQTNGILPCYQNLAGNAKQATRQALFKEQTGQCVYCGRGINLEDHGKFHIEHFRPRSLYPDSEVTYSNLFLSCGPQGQQGGSQQTCGNKKSDWFEEDCHVEPAPDEDCQRRFMFASNGRVQGDGSAAADKMIEILDLNYRELIVERLELIEELDGELKDGVPLRELVKGYRDLLKDGTRSSFANVAIQYLEKQGGCAQDA